MVTHLPDTLTGKWLVIGHLGKGNTGDEAMLESLLQSCPEAARHRLVIASPPEWRQAITNMGGVHTIGLSFRNVFYALRNVDGLVLCGGTWFHDSYGWRVYIASHFLSLLRLTVLHLLARLFRVPVAWISVGVGPLTRLTTKLCFRISAQCCRVIVVRDEASLHLCAQMGVHQRRLQRSLDVAVLLGAHDSLLPVESASSPAILGISITPLANFSGFSSDFDKHYLSNLCTSLTQLLTNNASTVIRLFDFGGGKNERDQHLTSVLYERLASLWPERVQCIPLQARASDTLRLISECDSLIATRYHAAVFGYIGGCKLLLLPYNKKVNDFADEIGLPQPARMRAQDALNVDKLSQLVHRLVDAGEDFRPKLNLSQAFNLCSRNIDTLLTVINEGCSTAS